MTRAALALLCASLAAAAGCAEVAPYERETLASARMALDPDADEGAMVRSRLRTREEGHVGAPGSASGGAGGGCGCN